MNIKVNEVQSFKLTTGEEIVAKVLEIREESVVLEHPILTALSPQGLQLMPGMFSVDLEKNVVLNKHSWVLVGETREDVRNSWIQITTGIQPVSKQILTG